ncbi:MAG: DUF3048 domain-containing protein [Firmicutes bacterium]|nr:DUF3048 domain-containing protein [Alicyclobacillaceae bacterium]MCL6498238.1 DUF3048 domain-containing protein [Bacillota bacterium]
MRWTRLGGLAAAAALLSACGQAAPKAPTSHPASPEAPSHAATALDPLTNLPTPRHGPLVAVMVENSEYGRPQWGLRSADVVYEAYTEFFYYPRYMLLYWGHAPAQVGPVRSARPYFVSWVREWDAAYAHAGSSSPATAAIARDGIHNLDLDSNAQALGTRLTSRPAPHNLVTDIAAVMATAARQWGNPPVAPHWPFAPQAPGTPSVQTITLTWNPRNSVEQWRWNSALQGWTRWVSCPECASGGGFQEVMGLNSGAPVVAKNVVIQETTESYLPDPAHTGWIQIQTQGRGPALLFLGHQVIRGTWEKTGPGAPTRFYTPNGTLAPFDPGPTWIEVVPNPKTSVATPFHLSLSPRPVG